jgi:hypothetical protein
MQLPAVPDCSAVFMLVIPLYRNIVDFPKARIDHSEGDPAGAEYVDTPIKKRNLERGGE